MNKSTDVGNKRWYIGVSLLATAITLLVFVTGKNVPDILNSLTQVKTTPTNQVGNLVTEYFPLFVGSTRTYSIGRSAPQEGGGDGLVEIVSQYAEQVILVESSPYEKLHIYKVEQTGNIVDLDCTGFEPTNGPVYKWYITDEKNLYVACSEEEKNKIAGALYAKYFQNTPLPEAESMLPKIIFPLDINNQWPAFIGITSSPEDKMYEWYVESKEVINTSAGKFDDCYKIVLYTNPDASFKYICKGIGIVAIEYHHYGTPVNYRVELSSYSFSGTP